MRNAGTAVEQGSAPEGTGRVRLGQVRWTICAMLFAATSINYMDRQVIAILEPTLQHSDWADRRWTTATSSPAFRPLTPSACWPQGWLIDRLGTRLGYCLFMGIWALSAMAPLAGQQCAGVWDCAL